ncbi:hypothetical protein BJY52DRAFT_842799 [Lactarius psammicola]|nr:hypothetical protein BJY52DRAFT_842799 [Lactarius psammicola]
MTSFYLSYSHHMSTSIQVFIPLLSGLCSVPLSNTSCVEDLLNAIWKKEKRYLRAQRVEFPQLSLRSLVYPVPLEPQDTLHKRVVASARTGWAGTGVKDEVPFGWSDPKNVHVYLYIDQGPKMQAAETLYDKLWGEDLNVILKEMSDNGTTWKYVSETDIDFQGMLMLRYREPRGLLVRPEYDVALGMLDEDFKTAKDWNRGGVVVTGQPGIGKSCFLYYLLLRSLSAMRPVALELPRQIIIFQDNGVYSLPLTADPNRFPEGTWALSDSNVITKRPCNAFLEAAGCQRAWIIQTTSPLEVRWKEWSKEHNADVFVMKYFSIDEITALSKLFGLDVGKIQRLYERWGPSVRTCVMLSKGGEDSHEHRVKNAANSFVTNTPKTPEFDETKVSHILFSIRPEKEDREGRMIQIPEIATDHIKTIISYAAADAKAQERIDFYQTISTQPGFMAAAGEMFQGFVLSWLYARSGVPPIRCISTGMPDLEIPACGVNQTTFFGSKGGLTKVNGDRKDPLCLLPTSKNFPFADAVVITNECIITIQVTVSHWHTANESGFTYIKNLLPSFLKRNKWRHVFITDNDDKAVSLRNQTLSGVPEDAVVYSGVFDIGRSGVTREDMEAYNDERNKPPTSHVLPGIVWRSSSWEGSQGIW